MLLGGPKSIYYQNDVFYVYAKFQVPGIENVKDERRRAFWGHFVPTMNKQTKTEAAKRCLQIK